MPTSTILLADPDPLQRQLIDVLLAEDGYQLVDVSTAREALQYLREHTPDLILLAMALPDADGDVVCEKAKSVSRLAHVPVILAAPATEELGIPQEFRQRARAARADLLLQKPLGDKNLRERVRSLLAAHASQRDDDPDPTKTTRIIEDALATLTDADGAGPAETADAAATVARENEELRFEVAALRRKVGRLETALRKRSDEAAEGADGQAQAAEAGSLVHGGPVAAPHEPAQGSAEAAAPGAPVDAGAQHETDPASLQETVARQARQIRELERRNKLLNEAIEELKENDAQARGLFGRRRG